MPQVDHRVNYFPYQSQYVGQAQPQFAPAPAPQIFLPSEIPSTMNSNPVPVNQLPPQMYNPQQQNFSQNYSPYGPPVGSEAPSKGRTFVGCRNCCRFCGCPDKCVPEAIKGGCICCGITICGAECCPDVFCVSDCCRILGDISFCCCDTTASCCVCFQCNI